MLRSSVRPCCTCTLTRMMATGIVARAYSLADENQVAHSRSPRLADTLPTCTATCGAPHRSASGAVPTTECTTGGGNYCTARTSGGAQHTQATTAEPVVGSVAPAPYLGGRVGVDGHRKGEGRGVPGDPPAVQAGILHRLPHLWLAMCKLASQATSRSLATQSTQSRAKSDEHKHVCM